MTFDYDAYIATFCTGDDEALIDRFFADDVTFTAGTRQHRGKAGLRQFLAWAHNGVREVPRVQARARSGDMLFAEVDMDFHCTRSRPDFPFGSMEPGDLITVKFFVTYRLDADERIAELKSMTWPPERGVTKLPRLGGHPSQIAAYHAYCAAFSNADAARFGAFYHPDVTLELGSVPPIVGADGIAAFYGDMFSRVREHLTIHHVLADDDYIALDATSRFTAIADAPDFVVAPLKAGEAVEVGVFVHYDLDDGLIRSIRVGRAGGRAPRAVAPAA